ncbi:hypothetical protein GUJ93_ZPchr0013g34849 [Zizania palustris]|uniref:Uncharacterized protein n=1 Tax=Zizania palustris TaxID=103762 RepID=A0A8J6C0I5_ZIZPA|nr:hypothetical protein GUJ93_ZPchr0013g34849 [Zizania palustris]
MRTRSVLDMAEKKIANELAVEGSTVLLTTTTNNSIALVAPSAGNSVGGSNNGEQRKQGGGKKWKQNNKNRWNNNGNAGAFDNFGSRGAPAPGGGPWFCFSAPNGPPSAWASNWGGSWRMAAPGILGPRPSGG